MEGTEKIMEAEHATELEQRLADRAKAEAAGTAEPLIVLPEMPKEKQPHEMSIYSNNWEPLAEGPPLNDLELMALVNRDANAYCGENLPLDDSEQIDEYIQMRLDKFAGRLTPTQLGWYRFSINQVFFGRALMLIQMHQQRQADEYERVRMHAAQAKQVQAEAQFGRRRRKK